MRSLSPGLTVLVAVVGVLLAGPTHLWLEHGCSDHVHGPTGEPVVTVAAVTCHAGCAGHGPAAADRHTVPEATEQEPTGEPTGEPAEAPCEAPAGGCDTCILLATTTPIEFEVGTVLPDLVDHDTVTIEIAMTDGRSQPTTRRLRGPPALA